MSSKLDYLKKYVSKGEILPRETGDKSKKKKKRKKVKLASGNGGGNFAIVDDDVDWRSLVPQNNPAGSDDEDDPEDKPIVAEVRDETVVKWQPFGNSSSPQKEDRSPNLSPSRPSSTDISPPRHDLPDISPPRRKRHDSPDISPPRRKRHDSTDISPPRRKRHDSTDISPPRRKRHNSSNISKPQPQISRKKSDRDLSSPQRKPSTSKHSPPPRAKSSPQPTSRPPRMSSGKKAGLQDAEVLRQENAAAREREAEMFHRMDPSESGLGAETVYRDKEGKRINLKLERLKKMQEENKKMEEEEKFMEWGKGVATIKMAEEKIKDELYEMSKPLARYADDEDLERMLKARERDGDPMLKFLKKKPQLTPTGKPKKERPTYKGFFPPSRFGIRPGFRWDGVDRTNGFEKAWFARESNRKATADDAYKWSVENM